MSQQAAIVAKGIFKQFDGNAVLKGVDFDLARGEIHAVVGQNGAGKSTLMKVLNGTHQPDQGSLSIFGRAASFGSTSEARSRGIAMVYQELSLVPTMSVADNIFMNNWIIVGGLLDADAMRAATLRLLDKVGIANEISPDQLVESLSMGQRQLVEIAKALSSDAKIIILDEPTASLSDQEIERLFVAIRRLQSEGVSLIYITHYLRDIFKICNRVSVLRDGRCMQQWAVSETSVPQLVASMLGEAVARQNIWQRATTDLPQSATPLLEVENLVTSHLDEVSFKVYPGQIVGLAGLLGSGRTEILNAIFGLDRLYSGQIRINGRAVQIHSPAQAIAHGINLVPEDRRSQGLILDFSVMDNLWLCALRKLANPVFIDQNRAAEMAHDLVKRLQVKTTGIDQAVRFLSGGNQQKVVIGKCLHTQAKVLLLDDPTFGIDLAAKHEIMHIVNDYVQQGNAVVFVSSEYSEIASFCDTTYIVKKGRIAGQLAATTEERLLAAVQ